MKRIIEKKFILRRNMVAVIGICLSFYFSYHLIAGERGYFRLMSLESQVAQTEQTLQNLTAEREYLESRVVMMRPGSIDKDLLEERARYVLGYRYMDELILLQGRS